ncbi:hypothetical protein AXF19_06725 [Selenomonas sp. oral taxon 126]|nr:hypothetical protein AXF19_06725 [Selenomonas sp. oral taxon 126]
MTMTRPLRLMILHFSQIFLTDGLTFTALASFRLLTFKVQVDLFYSSTENPVWLVFSGLFEAICNTSTSQIVRGEFDGYLVARQNTDEVHAYLSGYMSEDDVSILKFDLEHRIGKLLDDSSLYLDDILF